MGNRSPYFKCLVCCLVALCRQTVVVESVNADEGYGASGSASPDAGFQPAAPSLLFEKHQEEMGEEREHSQQAQEQPRQPDETSAALNGVLSASGEACRSFVEQESSPDTDVSCFSHDDNTGCQTPSIEKLTTPDVQACLLKCRKRPDCSHYTFNKISLLCYLKNGIPELYTKEGDMTGPRSCKSSCYESCVTYSATPWKTLSYPNSPPQICHSACWATRDVCTAFSFRNGECKLFSKGFSAYRTVGDEDVVTSPRQHCETTPTLRWTELNDGNSLGSCLKSDDIGSKAANVAEQQCPSVQECQKKCAANNKCTHYVYNKRLRKCYQKSGEVKYYGNRDDATGDRDCVPD